jgi:hypothetical protein
MTLVNVGGMPLLLLGQAGREGVTNLPALTAVTIDAVNEAYHGIGQVFWEDGGSHTVDTTGSSKFEFRVTSGSFVFANAGSTVKVGLAAVDTTNGPAGRAVNVADVITFDVSKSFTGGGGVLTTGWQSHTPSAGTKTVAHGDTVVFCMQMTARGGVDSVNMQGASASPSAAFPYVTQFVGGTYTVATSLLPVMVLIASDGTLGYFFGSSVLTSVTTQTWNNGSALKEHGNLIVPPFPGRVHGLAFNTSALAAFDAVLYSDPLGTPVAERTVSIDENTVASNSNALYHVRLFSSPYDFTANQPLGAILKPTTVTDISAQYITVNDALHQNAYAPGSSSYAINRASGAFAAQNSQKDRFGIGLLVSALDTGGYPASRMRLGM